MEQIDGREEKKQIHKSEDFTRVLKSHSGSTSLLRTLSPDETPEEVTSAPTDAGLFYSLESMLSQLVHTGKNYLGPIKGYASLIQDDDDQDDNPNENNTRRWADKIMRNVAQMERYFQSLSMFRITGSLGVSMVSWHQMVSSVLDVYSARNEKCVPVEVVDNARGTIRQHGELLKSVLVHVLNNAYESTSYGDRISLTISNADVKEENGHKQSVIVEISDTGCGIEGKNADLIWRPFFSTKKDHIGLGLPFVAAASPVLGMDVKLESTADRGTTVTLVLTEQGGQNETQTVDRR